MGLGDETYDDSNLPIEITKEDFIAYERVRASGVTNMFMITIVKELSGLSKEKILFIMENYGDLLKKYPDVRKSK